MQIKLSPRLRRGSETLTVARKGSALIINSQTFNFSQLAEGETLPHDAIDSEWFLGDVTRIGGELHLTLLLPHGPNSSEAERFPEPIHVTEDGPIKLPGDTNDD